MPVIPASTSENYPTLIEVMNLVRAIMNDSFAGATGTPGEGQIVTDNATISPFTAPILNSSMREMYRKLRISGVPTLIKDNFIITALAAVDGPLGSGVADPSIQVRIGFDGYDPGSGTVVPAQALPADLIMPLRMWERATGSNDAFQPMTEAQDGLDGRDQVQILADWEWRTDNIYMNGCTMERDVRIRYQQAMPEFFSSDTDFSTTQIPVFDSEEVVAYGIVKALCPTFGASNDAIMQITQHYNEAIHDMRSEQVRRNQRRNFRRQAYSDDNTIGSWPYSL